MKREKLAIFLFYKRILCDTIKISCDLAQSHITVATCLCALFKSLKSKFVYEDIIKQTQTTENRKNAHTHTPSDNTIEKSRA